MTSSTDRCQRPLSAAGVPSIKEPPDTSKLDGKRPDGITIVPWKSGKSLAWDVTVADTYAPSYLDGTVHTQGWAAEAAAKRKLQKYAALANTCHFIPVAFESMGGLCAVGQDFVSAIGSRITTNKRRSKGNRFPAPEVISGFTTRECCLRTKLLQAFHL